MLKIFLDDFHARPSKGLLGNDGECFCVARNQQRPPEARRGAIFERTALRRLRGVHPNLIAVDISGGDDVVEDIGRGQHLVYRLMPAARDHRDA